MNKHSMITALKSLGGLLCAFGAVVWTSACGRGIDEAVWTEEVRLHDGQTVLVSRRATAYASGFPNARRGADIEFELKYAPLGVHWKGDRDLRPISFEIFDGVPYLVLNFQLKKHCRDKKPTDYRAKILRWERGQWTEIPQAEFPLDRALLNLYRRYWGHGPADDASGGITWKHKAMRDGFNPDRPDTVKQYFDRRGTGDSFHCSRATEH